MEPIDRKLANALSDRQVRPGPARILIVAEESRLRDTLVATLQNRHHRCTCAGRVEDGRTHISRSRFDVILLSTRLPDGEGMDLAPLVQKTSPSTKTVVLSDTESVAMAVDAMRCGAVDFITVPIDLDDFARRIDSALIKSRVDLQREERLIRLKKICRELNIARHEVSQQVDTLCSDLVAAYEGVADQMNEVAMAAEFRTLLKQELDVGTCCARCWNTCSPKPDRPTPRSSFRTQRSISAWART
jgi:DNA-binding response OmpR family regulator